MLFQVLIGKSCGKAFIVQKPYPHSAFLSFFQDKTEILPPFFFSKLFMYAAFHTEFVDPAILDRLDLLAQYFMRLPMLPEKGQNIFL